jgi:hypothetical protein
MEQASDKTYETRKQRNLILGIVFDCIGMMSFSIPFVGEFSDIIWAPASGLLMTWMYKGTVGKVSGVLSFLEEIIPFTDVIPTFTLTWIYTYIIRSDKGKAAADRKQIR